eukprot:CAMPEP_0202391054 /NCGR_PEP_ID=MMETSP1127-20130417/91632_1 /ASSEMBLY_ACC=CAM_ASM_000462 /TAXON_ID=3047 /ORGANISM="Dunaliella tertiolecta, Strain CCMP1320" /LENGTH=1081 /DNA_ID=CAMNT_0048993461 /DNA_START=1318 /DNA_END=4560 /DNA_ORIENTATION=+
MAQWKIPNGSELPQEVYSLPFEAYWSGEEKWFKGKIKAFHPTRAFPFRVRYADGDECNCRFEDGWDTLVDDQKERFELRWRQGKPDVNVLPVNEGPPVAKRGRGRPKGSGNKQAGEPAAKRGRGAAGMQRRESSASEPPEEQEEAAPAQSQGKKAKARSSSAAPDSAGPSQQHAPAALEPAASEAQAPASSAEPAAESADGAGPQEAQQPKQQPQQVQEKEQLQQLEQKRKQKQKQKQQAGKHRQQQEDTPEQAAKTAKTTSMQQNKAPPATALETSRQELSPPAAPKSSTSLAPKAGRPAAEATVRTKSSASADEGAFSSEPSPATSGAAGTASAAAGGAAAGPGAAGAVGAAAGAAATPPVVGKQRTPVQHPGSIKQESRQVLMLDQSGQEARAPSSSSSSRGQGGGASGSGAGNRPGAGPRSKALTFGGEGKSTPSARSDLLRSASAGLGTSKQTPASQQPQPQQQQQQQQQPQQQEQQQQQQQQSEDNPMPAIRSPTYSPSGNQAEVATGPALGPAKDLAQEALLRSLMGGGAAKMREGGDSKSGQQPAGDGGVQQPNQQQQQQQSAAPGVNGHAGDGVGGQQGRGAPAAEVQQPPPLQPTSQQQQQQQQQQQPAPAFVGPQRTVVGAGGRVTKLPPSQGRPSRSFGSSLSTKQGAAAPAPSSQQAGSNGQEGGQSSVPELQALLPRLTLSNDGIKTMAVKVLEAMKAMGAPAVMRCILERSTHLRNSKTSVERLHLLYLVDNTLSKIDRIYRETPEEGHPALKEFPLKLGAAIQQLISGIATDPALQHKVGRVLNVWDAKKLVQPGILKLAKEAYEGDLELATQSKLLQAGQQLPPFQQQQQQQQMQEVGGRLLPVGPPRMATTVGAMPLAQHEPQQMKEMYQALRTPSKPDVLDPVQRRTLHRHEYGPHKIVLPQPPQAFVDAGLAPDRPGTIGIWNLMGPRSNVFILGNQYGSMGAKERERRGNSFASRYPEALEEVYGVLPEFEDGGLDDSVLFEEDEEDLEMARRLPWKEFCLAAKIGIDGTEDGQQALSPPSSIGPHALPLPTFQLPQLPTGAPGLEATLQQQQQQQQQQQ